MTLFDLLHQDHVFGALFVILVLIFIRIYLESILNCALACAKRFARNKEDGDKIFKDT